jgi:tRNA (guanine-N7-)-methyltransferase
MGAPGRPTHLGEGAWGQHVRPLDEGRLLEQNPYVALHRDQGELALPAEEAWRWKGRWAERFGRQAPLVLEIGPGNGSFLAALAARHPEMDHVAIEIRYKRVVACARKLAAAGLTNALVCRYHAAHTEDLFEPGSLSAIWVNHPDPWPKERHEKNRLVSRWFLQDVARLLAVGGVLRLKSDFRPNVERTVELLGQSPPLPLQITGRSEDITTGPAPWEGDIETGYQKKFRLRGEPVYAIELVRVEGEIPMQG